MFHRANLGSGSLVARGLVLLGHAALSTAIACGDDSSSSSGETCTTLCDATGTAGYRYVNGADP